MQLTLDQQRANYAWQKIAEISKSDIDKYTNLAKATPNLVMNSGLMQTLAFLKAKNTAEHKAILTHITRWLDRRFFSKNENAEIPTFEIIMKQLYETSSANYMQYTQESLALLRWIRQFADAQKIMR